MNHCRDCKWCDKAGWGRSYPEYWVCRAPSGDEAEFDPVSGDEMDYDGGCEERRSDVKGDCPDFAEREPSKVPFAILCVAIGLAWHAVLVTIVLVVIGGLL